MSNRILHIGPDRCHRAVVLESIGFQLEECHESSEIERALRSLPEPVAVIVDENCGRVFHDAVALVRTRPRLPLILFGELQADSSSADFDLIIPVLHSPEKWLNELTALVANRLFLQVGDHRAGKEASHSKKEPGQVDADPIARKKNGPAA